MQKNDPNDKSITTSLKINNVKLNSSLNSAKPHNLFKIDAGDHQKEQKHHRPEAFRGANPQKLVNFLIEKTLKTKIRTEKDITSFFAEFGDILDAQILRDKQGNHKGCAFVKFASMTQADKAIEKLDKKLELPGVIYSVFLGNR